MKKDVGKRLFLGVIQGYRYFLSPDHGLLKRLFPFGVCRFSPTCSEYMEQAVKKYGWKGFGFGLRRIARCHPFTKGGVDPVPDCATITKH